jgi:mannose-6-phosphate isomerase
MATSERDLVELTRQPLLLPPNRVYRLWRGGAVLDRFQGRADPQDGSTPEEWVASTTVSRLPDRPPDEGLSQVRVLDGGRRPLKTLIEAFPEAMLGQAHVARFGAELAVLCKLLDSAMRLFIQAHPDQDFARRHLGSRFGKTEAWIVLATREIDGERPHILLGFREGVTEAEFHRQVLAQDSPAMVAALNRVPVAPGEVYLLQAGTPHALGPGVFLVEIQEPTDLVVNVEYRLFGRAEAQAFMGLPFEVAMRCFAYDAAGDAFVRRQRRAPRLLGESAGGREEQLIGPDDTPHFGAARLSVRGALPDRDRGRCYAGIVVEGAGSLEGDGLAVPLRAGATFFVPAASRHEMYRATGGPLTVIKCFPPRP